MKRAIFGGTFDPVHEAHLRVAREALVHHGLDEVIFVPAAAPPHKHTSTPFTHRHRMVELAIAGEPRFVASRIEEHRERSYSILTIEELRAAFPRDRFLFLIGADAFAEITTWHRWKDVIAAVDLIVVSRPGHRYAVPEGARVLRLETVWLDVSSSAIREAIASGRVPEGLTPAVHRYVVAHGLYGSPLPKASVSR